MASPAEIRSLTKEIKSLQSAWDAMNRRKSLSELLIIIRRKGWTTPADVIFTSGIVNALRRQTELLDDLTQTLIKGSRRVGRG